MNNGSLFLIVIDGLGVGAQEDAGQYGDSDANTLRHVCESAMCKLPNFQRLGLGNILQLNTVPPATKPLAAYGKMREVSPGKDSTTGHWEIAGIHLNKPFPTYPDGFPPEVIEIFCDGIGVDSVLCNMPYSGTRVIDDFGEQHLETGYPIVYTSADSVFQVAAHIDKIPLDDLYEWCRFAREHVCAGRHAVGRVIARPFEGRTGNFVRLGPLRRDYSLSPPEPNIVADCYRNGIKTYSIGKVVDLFTDEIFTQYRKTRNNAEGISQLLSAMSAVENSFVFVNLIDTDQLFGHRLDPEGFAGSLEEIDRALPAIIGKIKDHDLLIITGDHGNDPTVDSTDHSREYVPLLVYPADKAVDNRLGVRSTFSDIACSAADFFDIPREYPGNSFLRCKKLDES